MIHILELFLLSLNNIGSSKLLQDVYIFKGWFKIIKSMQIIMEVDYSFFYACNNYLFSASCY